MTLGQVERRLKVLAVEDGSFPSDATVRKRKGKALLVGVVTLGFRVEEVLLSRVAVDGLDATERLITMAEGRGDLDAVMLASISYAGFNLMDPAEIFKRLQVPVVVVNPKKPDDTAVESAIRNHFPDWKKRLTIIQKTGPPKELHLDGQRRVYFHAYGLPVKAAEKMIKDLTVFGNRPEPLRIARLLAHGLGRVR